MDVLQSTLKHAQNSMLLQGIYRQVHSGFFKDMSDDCFDHAREIGEFVVALGGIPTVEPAPIRYTIDLTTMLNLALDIETEALNTYSRGVELAGNNIPFRVILENMALGEYKHKLKLQKILSKFSLQIPDATKEVRIKQV